MARPTSRPDPVLTEALRDIGSPTTLGDLLFVALPRGMHRDLLRAATSSGKTLSAWLMDAVQDHAHRGPFYVAQDVVPSLPQPPPPPDVPGAEYAPGELVLLTLPRALYQAIEREGGKRAQTVAVWLGEAVSSALTHGVSNNGLASPTGHRRP